MCLQKLKTPVCVYIQAPVCTHYPTI
jgi:hypothetical protein